MVAAVKNNRDLLFVDGFHTEEKLFNEHIVKGIGRINVVEKFYGDFGLDFLPLQVIFLASAASLS